MSPNIEVLSLRKTPMWDWISTYCEIRKRGSAKAALQYLNSDNVPLQLKRQVKEVGDQLIAHNIEP